MEEPFGEDLLILYPNGINYYIIHLKVPYRV